MKAFPVRCPQATHPEWMAPAAGPSAVGVAGRLVPASLPLAHAWDGKP